VHPRTALATGSPTVCAIEGQAQQLRDDYLSHFTVVCWCSNLLASLNSFAAGVPFVDSRRQTPPHVSLLSNCL
jgi:hypothetical protein